MGGAERSSAVARTRTRAAASLLQGFSVLDHESKNSIYSIVIHFKLLYLPFRLANSFFQIACQIVRHPLAKKNRLLSEMKFAIGDQELTEEVCIPLAHVSCPPRKDMCTCQVRISFPVRHTEHKHEDMVRFTTVSPF
jgi:hypothetical protein